jgi:hypothetical protein
MDKNYKTYGIKSMQNKHKLLWIIIPIGLLVAAMSLFWVELPWMANHFGFALSGKGGLPYRITYSGRDYSNLATCAHADWCQSTSPDTGRNPLCWKKEDIQHDGYWPLVQVGTISTFLGSPYSLMAPQSQVSSNLTVISAYIASGTNCYVPYELEGSP